MYMFVTTLNSDVTVYWHKLEYTSTSEAASEPPSLHTFAALGKSRVQTFLQLQETDNLTLTPTSLGDRSAVWSSLFF